MVLSPVKYWYQIFKKFYKNFIHLIFFISLGLSSFLFSQSFEEVDLEEINDFIEKIQNYRNTYTNYHARFREISDNNLLIGDLYYSKPDQLRITYYRGKNIVTDLILSETKLSVYFVKWNIVYQQENFNTYDQSIPMQPGSIDYLLKKYNFNFKNDKEPIPVFKEKKDYRRFNLTANPDKKAYHMQLTSKNVTEVLDDLEVWFLAIPSDDGESYLPGPIIRAMSYNIAEVTNDIYFYEINTDQQFPSDIYDFVIPNHVRIVKNFFTPLENINLNEYQSQE